MITNVIELSHAHLCTITGLFRGICDHLCITLIPIPLADAGYKDINQSLICLLTKQSLCHLVIQSVIHATSQSNFNYPNL